MKKIVLALSMACSTLALPACQRPVTIVTPQGQIAYTADQIVLRVSELQNLAVHLNTSGVLDIGTTRTIMQWSINAATVLKTLPNGWRVTLQQSWIVAKMEIKTTNPAVQSAMAAVDAVLGGI